MVWNVFGLAWANLIKLGKFNLIGRPGTGRAPEGSVPACTAKAKKPTLIPFVRNLIYCISGFWKLG